MTRVFITTSITGECLVPMGRTVINRINIIAWNPEKCK